MTAPHWLLDLLWAALPTRCAGCGNISRLALCDSCRQGLQPITLHCLRCGRLRRTSYAAPDCGSCSGQTIGVQRARSLALYNDTAQKLLAAFKYERRLPAGKLLCKMLEQALTAGPGELFGLPELKIDAVLPVPLHRSRQRRRRFNQSLLLARSAAQCLRSELCDAALLRVRDTPSQVGLTAAQRRTNVQGAFAVPAAQRARIRGRSLLLVDDLLTTGSTLRSCAAALRRGGSGPVYGLTVFSTLDKHFSSRLPGPAGGGSGSPV